MPSRPIKILMLHGYTQSGPLFHAKTKALEKHLQKSLASLGGVELVYPTAPIRLRMDDLPTWSPTTTTTTTTTPADLATAPPPHASATAEGGDRQYLSGTPVTMSGAVTPSAENEEAGEYFAWWRRNDALQTYTGLPSPCLDYLCEFLSKQGPFDGAIGFSQGAACAAILASLLEPIRRSPPTLPSDWPSPLENQPPLAFTVCYSGFRAPYKQYDFIYEPKIETPVMHFIGSLDTVMEEERCLTLVRACKKERVVYHPGGHYLPGGKIFLGAVTGFIVECLKAREKKAARKEEESVEEMDVPF